MSLINKYIISNLLAMTLGQEYSELIGLYRTSVGQQYLDINVRSAMKEC